MNTRTLLFGIGLLAPARALAVDTTFCVDVPVDYEDVAIGEDVGWDDNSDKPAVNFRYELRKGSTFIASGWLGTDGCVFKAGLAAGSDDKLEIIPNAYPSAGSSGLQVTHYELADHEFTGITAATTVDRDLPLDDSWG